MRKINLLCIDDSQGILDTVKVLCSRLGYNFYGLLDNDGLMRTISEKNIDIVVVDYVLLDGLKGTDVISEIREYNENIYIIMLTGFSEMLEGKKALLELDIDSYAVKDANLDDFSIKLIMAGKAVTKFKTVESSNLNFGQRLRFIREKYHLKQEDIANILEVKRSAVANYENGFNTPKLKHIIMLSDYFNVPTDYFLKNVDTSESLS